MARRRKVSKPDDTEAKPRRIPPPGPCPMAPVPGDDLSGYGDLVVLKTPEGAG